MGIFCKKLGLLAVEVLSVVSGGAVGRMLRMLERYACSNTPRAADRLREDRLACYCSGSLVWLEVIATA
jgi:hypothetical protein